LPHSAFRGQSLDEINFETGSDIPMRLEDTRGNLQNVWEAAPIFNAANMSSGSLNRIGLALSLPVARRWLDWPFGVDYRIVDGA